MSGKLDLVRNAVTSRFGRQVLKLQKHSPIILFAAGTVGMITTVVLASKATLHIEEILDEHRETMEKINCEDIIESEDGETYTADKAARDKAVLFARTAGKITRLYGPATVTGVLSIAALTGSHVILTNRNVGLAATVAAVSKGFEKYRQRVINEFGSDKDKEFRYGAVDRNVDYEKRDGTTGTKKVRKAEKGIVDEAMIYARWFDEGSDKFDPTPEYNTMFLLSQQNFWNWKLQQRGHVFLNEVYEALGFKQVAMGQQVGWLKDGDGDGFIDFGVFDDKQQARDFINCWNDGILLDFNVDGTILDKI